MAGFQDYLNNRGNRSQTDQFGFQDSFNTSADDVAYPSFNNNTQSGYFGSPTNNSLGTQTISGAANQFVNNGLIGGSPLIQSPQLDTDQFGFTDYSAGGDQDILASSNLQDDKGFFDQLSNKDMIGAGFGVAQLGLGLGNYFENKKLNKARRAGLNQQVAESRYAVSRNKKFTGDVSKAFG